MRIERNGKFGNIRFDLSINKNKINYKHMHMHIMKVP